MTRTPEEAETNTRRLDAGHEQFRLLLRQVKGGGQGEREREREREGKEREIGGKERKIGGRREREVERDRETIRERERKKGEMHSRRMRPAGLPGLQPPRTSSGPVPAPPQPHDDECRSTDWNIPSGYVSRETNDTWEQTWPSLSQKQPAQARLGSSAPAQFVIGRERAQLSL